MHRNNRFRRPSPPPAAPLAELPPVEEPSAASPAPGEAAYVLPAPTAPAAFRVGNYEVGDGFCPHLWGHPDIRY